MNKKEKIQELEELLQDAEASLNQLGILADMYNFIKTDDNKTYHKTLHYV